MWSHLPNTLTVLRIAAIPVIGVLLAVGSVAATWWAFALYVLACVTDFFDGYLARACGLGSSLGRMLDPIADKLLVAALLLLLINGGTIAGPHVIPAILIVCRELLVSGLREHMALSRVAMPVSRLAKYKTTVQMIALGCLIVADVGPDLGPVTVLDVGLAGLWIATLLTLITGFDYLRVALASASTDDVA